MTPPIFPGRPQPGQHLRWRHPRRAFALGLFDAYGPGPFEVLGTTQAPVPDGELLVVVKTEQGAKEVEAVCLEVAPTPQDAPATQSEQQVGSLAGTE